MPTTLNKEHTVTSQRGHWILTQVFYPGVGYNNHVITVSYTENSSFKGKWMVLLEANESAKGVYIKHVLDVKFAWHASFYCY